MKQLTLTLLALVVGFQLQAQQKLDNKGMSYIMLVKPNAIIYQDTLYQGARQFKQLFYQTHDVELMSLYHRHQSNKIWGSIVGTAGAATLLAGISIAADNKVSNQSTVWGLIGAGFAASLTGGYLINISKTHLGNAVHIFNAKYTKKTTAAVGITHSGNIGLVVKL